MTKSTLERLYKAFYKTSKSNPLTTGQDNVTNRLSKRTSVMLDEFSRAPLDIRQASLQLVLDRKIHQHELPIVDGQRTFIIAADNPDDGTYAVETLDPALLDRFICVPVECDTQDWLDWARRKKVNKLVRSFLADNPSKLHFAPEEGSEDVIGATPRSWTKLAAYIDNFTNIPTELHYTIIHGKIGKAVGLQFLNFYNNYKNMVSVEDIELLVKNINKNDIKIEQIGEAISELLEDAEVIQQTELTKSIVEKYIDAKPETYESKVLLGILYSLNVELLISSLRALDNDSEDKYYKIVELDKVMNKKQLFVKVAKNLSEY